MDQRAILDRNAELKTLRSPFESQYRQLAKFLRPEQSDMFDGNSRTDHYSDLFDATGLQALDAFAGGMFANLSSPSMTWFEFALEDRDLAAYGPVKRWLYEVRNAVMASLSPAMSNFYAELPAFYSDLGAFGVATLYQEEAVGAARFIDRTIPLGETLIDLDANGEVDTFHRNFRLKGAKLKTKYPEAAGLNLHDAHDYELVHAVFRNPGYREGQIGPAGFPWLSCTVARDLPQFRRVSGYYEMPFSTVLWARRPGRVWPVGPGHAALPDMRMLNEMERAHIIAAQFAAEPPLLLHDEDVLTPADVAPRALLYGTVSDRGQPLAIPLSTGGNVQLSLDMANQRRETVKDAFFFSIMQLRNRPQMTATEVNAFQSEQLRQMAPNLARLQAQGLSPFLTRRFALLMRAGQLPPPPDELEGQPLSVSYVSPLAQLQRQDEARATMAYVAQLGNVAAVTGDRGLLDNLDGDAAAAVLHAALGAPPSVQRDAHQLEQIRGARQQVVAQREQLANRAQEVETAATAAHAAQAGSLSDQRGAGL